MEIRELGSSDVMRIKEHLVVLAVDAVTYGAQLGWQNPLGLGIARTYWEQCAATVNPSHHLIFVAQQDAQVIGTVQLERGHFPTSQHRGEVAKLIVHSAHRREGVGSALMDVLERRASVIGIELLVLDTRPGEVVEMLYRSRGYTGTGLIPRWMKSAGGVYRDTIFYYKQLACV
ncbi:MAG: GNAT family N-acetyltransferase [Candidatus Eremiobacteraeota bacterium]|nr:GNAT family N-acetyltransferase [Candidatus Eremiobacteraeota bacterium]